MSSDDRLVRLGDVLDVILRCSGGAIEAWMVAPLECRDRIRALPSPEPDPLAAAAMALSRAAVAISQSEDVTVEMTDESLPLVRAFEDALAEFRRIRGDG